MEWNDMSKGKWDVRSRLSAERNKLSLFVLCSPELPGQHLPALGEAGLLGEMGEGVAGLTRDIVTLDIVTRDNIHVGSPATPSRGRTRRAPRPWPSPPSSWSSGW